jgi:hypothetical protein
MRNVHERHVRAPVDEVGAVLETLAGPHDRVWPGDAWPALALDRGLAVGSTGGHADIRYTVTGHDPGRRVELTFDPACGIVGTHVFEVADRGDGTTLLSHEIAGRSAGSMRLMWPLVVRWVHDAVVEDAFDRMERALGTGPAQPAAWTPYVRLLRAAHARSQRRPVVREVPTPPELLSAAALSRVDAEDTFAVRRPPGSSADVDDWHRTLLAAGSPPWVDRLMALRDLLVRPLRLRTAEDFAERSPFQPLSRSGDVLVLGADDRHLDVRAVLRVAGDDLELTTAVQLHNRVGRAYFAVVKPFHRRVVPALLRRTARCGPTATPARTR